MGGGGDDCSFYLVYSQFCSDWNETNIFIKRLAILVFLNVNKTKYRVTFFQFFADYVCVKLNWGFSAVPQEPLI